SYEERKKRNKGRGGRNWQQEFLDTRCSKAEAEARSEEAAAICTSLESELKEARKRLSALERAKTEARLAHKTNERSSSTNQKASYDILKTARATFYDERSKVEPQEEALRAAKQRKYYWNKVAKEGTRSGTKARREEQDSDTIQATWTRHHVEDTAERLNIEQLVADKDDSKRLITFGATDYGLATMSETSALTLSEAKSHANRYAVLYDQEHDQSNQEHDQSDQEHDQSEHQDTEKILAATPLPAPTFRITAAEINDKSFSRRATKRRELRLKHPRNKVVRSNIKRLSEASMTSASSMRAIDNAAAVQRTNKSIKKMAGVGRVSATTFRIVR
ncbi:hypothetical protein BGZ72_002691, partial [Mortierella alpina]